MNYIIIILSKSFKKKDMPVPVLSLLCANFFVVSRLSVPAIFDTECFGRSQELKYSTVYTLYIMVTVKCKLQSVFVAPMSFIVVYL